MIRPPRRDLVPPGPEAGLRGVLADAARLCPSTVEALLVDGDGVLVERYGDAGATLDSEAVGVESLAGTPALAKIAGAARLGGVQAWHVVGDRGILVVQRVPQTQLFVILRLPADASCGRARFAARVTAGRLAERLT